MDKSARKLKAAAKLYLFLILAFTIAAAALRTGAILTAFDSDIGYYSVGATLPEISTAVCVAGCVTAAALPWVMRRGANWTADAEVRSSSEYFVTAYAAFVMLGAFVYEIDRCFAGGTVKKLFDEAESYAANGNSYGARSVTIQAVIVIIGMIASAVSAVYFFLRISSKGSREWHALIGFAPGLRGVAGLASIYFDMTVGMNSPNKLILTAAIVAVMVYFLLELRMIFDANKARPRLYASVGLLTVVLAATASVSVMVGYLSGMLSNSYFFTEAFFCFNMAVYIAVRTFSVTLRAFSSHAAPNEAETLPIS